MVRVKLTKKVSKSFGSLFPVGFQVEGILVDKSGTHLELDKLQEQKEGVFLKTPSALTQFSERAYHFATDSVVKVSQSNGLYSVETVSGLFELSVTSE